MQICSRCTSRNGGRSWTALDRGSRLSGGGGSRGAAHATADAGCGTCDGSAALVALESSVAGARDSGDGRPSLVLLAACLADLGAAPPAPAADLPELHRARDDWLRRLRSSCRSKSALVAYRVAIDDLLEWSEQRTERRLHRSGDRRLSRPYRERAQPAPATYYRRFCSCGGSCVGSAGVGVADPFLDLEPPPKPRQERDWLTREEFRLARAAGRPVRNLPGLVERDRLVLLALVTTGLRRSELCALDWRDLELDGRKRSLLVRYGKGGKPRRQPLPAGLARELRALRDTREPSRPIRSSAGSPAAVCSRRSSPRSSAGRQTRRDREARHGAHAPPYRCDVAPAGARRHAPRRRVPRSRRPLDSLALRARRPRRALR